jgi:hypothetical protein
MFKSVLKSLAVASVLATTTVAAHASDDYIFIRNTQDFTTHVTIDLVRASGAGTVYVYDFHKGTQGDLLGSAEVAEGANTDVKVNFTKSSINDVVAILVVDGAVAPGAMSQIENSMNDE